MEAIRQAYVPEGVFSPGFLLMTTGGYDSSGLTISTYFSAIKLRWMIDHHESVGKAHEEDDLLFGTVESWIVYVCVSPPPVCSCADECF